MEVMKKCFFCGAEAPKVRKRKGIYSMTCSCGALIEHYNYESVVDLWNYTVK